MRVLVKGVCIATIAFSLGACDDRPANDNMQSANDDGSGAMDSRAVTGGGDTQASGAPGATGAPLPADGTD